MDKGGPIRHLVALLLVAFTTLLASNATAQAEEPGFIRRYVNSLINDTGNIADPQLLVYPTVAFAPETSWEIGFSTLYVYYAKRDTSNRLSEISGFTFYTLENQWGIWFDHALYSHEDKWFLLGRSRYQDFPLLFYGIGPDAPAEYTARVDGNYLLLRERVLRKMAPALFLGAEIDFQSLNRVDFKPASPNDLVSRPKGAEGSTNLGLGLGLVYDNRHNVLNVREGLFSELAFLRYDKTWGSDFSFTTVVSDSRIFKKINSRDVLAAQLLGQFTFAGDAPFNQLALMGGESLMRGYYLGRYRDNHLLSAQIEYRLLPFAFSERWGASAFMAAGQVFSAENKPRSDRFLPAGGAGIRFLLFPQKDIFVRLDIAFTPEGTGYYFFIGEAF